MDKSDEDFINCYKKENCLLNKEDKCIDIEVSNLYKL